MADDDPRLRPRTGATLLRLRQGHLDIEVFPPLLMKLAGLYRPDAARVCAEGSGILLDNLDPTALEAVARALREHGEPCFVVPAAALVPLPPEHPVAHGQILKDELELRDTAGKPHGGPWNKAIVLALGELVTETQQVKHRTGSILNAKMGYGAMMGSVSGGLALGAVLGGVAAGGGTRDTVTHTSRDLTLDLVFLEAPRRYRIESGHFDYSLLGEQRAATGEANLRTLARWFLYTAPHMATNVDRELLLAGQRPPLPRLHGPGFDGMVRWLINLVRFRKEAEAARGQTA
ncbi:MAG TPA: hypothetical protein VGM19_04845 [Armatimonadota bacterium]|jgi:hypothetical protein